MPRAASWLLWQGIFGLAVGATPTASEVDVLVSTMCLSNYQLLYSDSFDGSVRLWERRPEYRQVLQEPRPITDCWLPGASSSQLQGFEVAIFSEETFFGIVNEKEPL